MVFVRGDRSINSIGASANSTTLRSKGEIFTGTQVVNVPAKEDGFYSIGNPYASAVDVRKIDELGTTGTFYIWNPNPLGLYDFGAYETYTYLAGDYVAVVGGVTEPAIVNNYILSGQAFFVQSFEDPYNITFEESAKGTTTTNKEFFRPSGSSVQPVVLRSALYNANGKIMDGTLHIFGDNYSPKVNNADALKLRNSGANLSLMVDRQLLSVERRPVPGNADTIFLNLTGISAGKYVLSFEAQNLLRPGLEAWLNDAFTKHSTQIALKGIAEVPFEVTSDAASRVADRFMIVFAEKKLPPMAYTRFNALKNNQGVDLQWAVVNENNVSGYVVMHSTNEIDFRDIATLKNNHTGNYYLDDKNFSSGINYYRIRNLNLDGSEGFSDILKVDAGSFVPALSVYPNPVTDGFINLRIANYPEGNYQVRVLNAAGQVMLIHSFHQTGRAYTEKISAKNLMKGTYYLEVKSPDGSVKVISVLNDEQM